MTQQEYADRNWELAYELFNRPGIEMIRPTSEYSPMDATAHFTSPGGTRKVMLIEVKERSFDYSDVAEGGRYEGGLILERKKYDRLRARREAILRAGTDVRCLYLSVTADGRAVVHDVTELPDSVWIGKDMNDQTTISDTETAKTEKKVALLPVSGAVLDVFFDFKCRKQNI